MTIGGKSFRDKRLDAIHSSRVDIFGKKNMDLMREMEKPMFGHGKGGGTLEGHGLSTPSHDFGRSTGMGQAPKSLLDASARKNRLEKPKDESEGEDSFEKHLDKIKAAFKRKY